ncbi:MAG: 3-methyl-2-oxobutanoate hydroxymethyltransferase [Planctomycetes bacterium]|nr:3-methyl-2-oxobutanoate hydroxymethyltransferase [Planctomycetota bacterium]MCB9919088.1 3-methyl-2-oxobutanoate hydroxymethyltransferase [Planctomycetota bacterium]
MSTHRPESRKVTTEGLRRMKKRGERIACLTAYDALMAGILDASGIDVLLVGDSAGTVVQGLDTTIQVTLDQMLYHCSMVTRAVKRALVVCDLPFMTFQVSAEEALRSAGRLFKEAGAEAVKLEGGKPFCGVVQRLTESGIPVMGHLGLTPQSIHHFGTYRVRGEDEHEAQQILDDAKRLEDAGAFAIVLEKIPSDLARQVAESVEIPIIGIGAGVEVDGQILVTHDMLGLFTRFHPRFVRRYAEIAKQMGSAFEAYASDVRAGKFPSADESYD